MGYTQQRSVLFLVAKKSQGEENITYKSAFAVSHVIYIYMLVVVYIQCAAGGSCGGGSNVAASAGVRARSGLKPKAK